MPRYEIVAHIVRDIDAATTDDAAAMVGNDLRAAVGATGTVRHLAVWRQDPAPAASPLPEPVRHQLIDFFTALAQCADAAEAEFRGRVTAILAAPATEPGSSPSGNESPPAG